MPLDPAVPECVSGPKVVDTPGRIGILMLFVLTGLARAAGPVITLDGAGTGRMFEGEGAMSAGASSRLLIDYPEPYRGQILDYLFKPNYGASLQDLKVELGGDMNSTSGSEPSHMHTASDQNYNRGFEWWLMEQAKLRNPNITLGILAWGAPGWIGNGQFFSQDAINYIVNYIQGAKTYHNLTIDYVGILDERPYDIYWIIQLKAALRAQGLTTKIVAADMSSGKIIEDVLANPALMDAVDVLGFHYPRFDGGPIPVDKPIWASEDGLAWNWNGNWTGAAFLAKAYIRPYIGSKITRHQVWSLVTSYYDMLLFPGSGQMYANTPWSGNYLVQPAIWATAHTNQFAGPGWQYIDNSCGFLNSGSFVTLRKGSDFSLIIENVDGADTPVTFNIVNGLSTGVLHVWKSDQTAQFIQQPDIIPVNGSFSFTVAAGSIYSITTTTGQAKGNAAPPPAAPFPFPYADNFENYPLSAQAKYFFDLNGSFEIANCANGRSGLCLRQAAPSPPIPWTTIGAIEPSSVIGSTSWENYQVSADVFFEQPGTVKLMGRISGLNVDNGDMYGYQLYIDNLGNWSVRQGNFVSLANGSAAFGSSAWHALKMVFSGGAIQIVIDGTAVANLATNDTYPRGMTGLGVQSWTTAQFDNFRIDPLPGAGTPVSQSQITVTATGETPGYEAAKAVDGDSRTFWNSPFTCTGGCRVTQPLPQSLTLALGSTYPVQKVRYAPRQDDNQNGSITSYNVYVSSDGTNFTKVASGNWAADASEKSASFAATSASYVRLEAVSAVGGMAAASEVNVDYDPGGGSSNPAPAIGSLVPNSATAGDAGFVLSVSGSNFIAGSVVRWNGTERSTSFVNSTVLNAVIPAADLISAGTAVVTVVNLAPGGGVSSGQTFTINPTGNPTGGTGGSPGAGTPFVTGYALSQQTLRSDFAGWVGMKLTVGTNPLTVSALGRACMTGNSNSHLVKLVNPADGTDVSGGSIAVNMAGCTVGHFVYSSISPITLSAGTAYYLVSQETYGGDRWYDQGAVASTVVATVNTSVYSYNGNWYPIGAGNTSYVPPNFLYSTGSAPPPPPPPTQYLLTTGVSPAASGSVSAGGSYTSGTVVPLSATPAANCTFSGWTGNLTGSTNPASITMSGPQTVTANFQCSVSTPPSSGAFVTGYALSGQSLRNDFTGFVGMKLTVGASGLTVSSLGRICVANNAQSHTVKFVNASTGGDVAGASASVNMAGCTAGQFVYSSISPVTLSAGTSYYLVTQETQGGDRWYDQGAISATTDAVVNSAIYSWNGGWYPLGSANSSYVPPNFQYSTGGSAPPPPPQYVLTTGVSPAASGSVTAGGSYASGTVVQLTATPASNCTFSGWSGGLTGSTNPASITMSGPQTVTANFQCSVSPPPSSAAFLTGYALSGQPLRNDFTGFVGMKLTVGASALTVSSLGRICAANNAATHTVKFVNASTGVDIAGASASVNMAGCTVGQFMYSTIAPVTLSAGTSYYLVTLETQGGDLWYDQGAISATTAAAVNSAIYSWNGAWYPLGSANTSYAPPSFQYAVASGH